MSWAVDFLVFVGVLVLVKLPILSHFYPPLFLNESSEAFMQFTYYLHALRTHASFFWDHYLLLTTQEAPQTPLFSPVTLVLLVISQLLQLESQSSLAILYLAVSYLIQVAVGYSMYLFLRYLKLGRLASILGGIGYSYNYFMESFGIQGGVYRPSALALIPVVFILFHRLFASPRDTFARLVLAGFTLGLCFLCNGDVKPTVVFLVPLALVALVMGPRRHGWMKTPLLLFAAFAMAAMTAAVQLGAIYAALEQSKRVGFYVDYVPMFYNQVGNRLLSFSQTYLSLTSAMTSRKSLSRAVYMTGS